MEIFLETERLVLRRMTEADVGNLTDLDGDPDVMRYLNGGKPNPRDRIENEILPKIISGYERSGGLGLFAAVENASSAFAGWFQFEPTGSRGAPAEVELGYRLRRSVWGKGYATEGALALIRKGFTELGVRRVVAYTMAVNTASRRVMEKVGLRYVRTFHEDWDEPIEGHEKGEVEYALGRAEWRGEQNVGGR